MSEVQKLTEEENQSANDVQQLLVKQESPLERWSPSLDQDQKPPQIKDEQDEADITVFTFSPHFVKSEDDEDKPLFTQLHQQQVGVSLWSFQIIVYSYTLKKFQRLQRRMSAMKTGRRAVNRSQVLPLVV
uniref:Uncharacterized protein n=1 Tax=Nothobranchius korthausae TaxID=1143690 RepID=A0A1A8FCZ8_9TELE